jgi:hypothetical protein
MACKSLLDRNAVAISLIKTLGEQERGMMTDPGLMLSSWNEMLIRTPSS